MRKSKQGSKLLFPITDHLGSARIVVDSTGTVQAKYSYFPFGDNLSSWISQGTDYKFTGKELDEESGFNLYYFGARYYDAKIGRWVSVDPRGYMTPNLSPYVYCADNPLRIIDPTGKVLELTFQNEETRKAYLKMIEQNLKKYKASLGQSKSGSYLLKMEAIRGHHVSTAFERILNKVVSDKATTEMNVVSGSNEVLIGKPETRSVDVGDIGKFESGKVATVGGTLIHEIWEQYQMQTKGLEQGQAHEKAIREGEDVVNESRRMMGQRYEPPPLMYLGPPMEVYRHFTYEKEGKYFDIQLKLCIPDANNICRFREIEKQPEAQYKE